jgi:hypothetical protein
MSFHGHSFYTGKELKLGFLPISNAKKKKNTKPVYKPSRFTILFLIPPIQINEGASLQGFPIENWKHAKSKYIDRWKT